MTDRPTIDSSGLLVAFYRGLEPVKRFCRAFIPESARQSVLNISRAARFWANPRERRRMMAELQRCRTPEDYSVFATNYLGHLQLKQEITGFLNFAMTEGPVRICEIGLCLGGTNLMLTRVMPTVQLIVGIDLHIRNKSQLRYFANPSQKQIFIEGRSCDGTTLKKVAHALGSEKLDLLFIDADHSYAGVKQDFMHYRHFVRDGGIIAFHDIIQDHFTRFEHDPISSLVARSGEVYLFWKRLKPYYENTREFVINYEQDGSGIGALIYSSKVAIPEDL
jgi:predicted O-methyltransferase YrrM